MGVMQLDQATWLFTAVCTAEVGSSAEPINPTRCPWSTLPTP